MDKVVVAGISIPLRKWLKNEMRGIPLIYSVNYRFYDFSFHNNLMIMLESDKHYTPKNSAIVADRIERQFGRPVVFYFDRMAFYERKRYIERGVFYIAGDTNAYLPMLMTSRLAKRKMLTKLSAAAQYLIMSHLQVESIEHLPLHKLAEKLPYSYVSIAKAVQNLEDLGLCSCYRDSDGSKSIGFGVQGKELWEMAKPFMSSPAKERFYCTRLPQGEFPLAGISALATYSNLSNDPEISVALYSKQWNKEQFENWNTFDGPYVVELWRYPIIGKKAVDKLSLCLSLENSGDPRVEKELQSVFNGVWKK